MKHEDMSKLYDKDASVQFYEQRYANCYMDRWPIEKKRKIIEIIRSLDLPLRGEALDYGCGIGELTESIRQALPTDWKVFGTDISTVAVCTARERYVVHIFCRR